MQRTIPCNKNFIKDESKKIPTLFLLASLTLASCKYDDSELWEQVNQNTEELADIVDNTISGSDSNTNGGDKGESLL